VSDSESSQATETGQEIPQEWLADKWGKVRMAHEAIMVEDARKILSDNRKTTKGHISGVGGLELADGDAGEMHIGDSHTTVNNFVQDKEQPQYQPPQKPGVVDTMLKAGLAAAAIGTAGSLPILAYNLTKAAPPAPAPVIVNEQQPTVDTDTQYDLRIFKD